MTTQSSPNVPNSTQTLLKRAVDLYRKDDAVGAVKALGSALDADPFLRDNARVRELAARITNLNPDAALRILVDIDRRDAFILKYGTRKRAPASGPGRALSMIIAVLLVAVGLGLVYIVANRYFFPLINPFSSTSQTEHRTLESDPAQEYYVVTPDGEMPEMGWPTLVAIHAVGQTGLDMVNQFGHATCSNGILLVAPTFTSLFASADPQSYQEARNKLLLILDEMEIRAFQRPNTSMYFLGQVYFGYVEGASFVTWLADQGLDYADEGFAIKGPLAVALAGVGSKLYAQPARNVSVPYLVTVGENDPHADRPRNFANKLQNQGFPVRLEVIPGTGAELSQRQIDLTLELVKQVYHPN